MSSRIWAVLLAGIALLVAACATAPRGVPHVASPEEALARAQALLDDRRQRIDTVHAGLELEWISPDLDEEVSCRASMVFRDPDRLRVRGTSAAFFTVFDLAADPDTIRFDVPREKILVRGARDDEAWSRFPLDPDLIAIALLGHPDPFATSSDRIVVEAITPDSLMATGESGVVRFDPASGMPATFQRTGRGSATIAWTDWEEVDGELWPMRVSFGWPETGEELRVRFGRVQFGRPVRDDSFSEDPDDKREILDPQAGLERWRLALIDAAGPEE